MIAAAVAGCGVGFGAGDGRGSAELTISRDYGSRVLVEEGVGPIRDSSTVMRLLDGEAEIETSYGGGFVEAIDGIASSTGSRSSDWFFFVNGVAAERGAGEFSARPGDRIWWDFRDWTDAMEVNAVVGSFPEPLRNGHDGTVWPVDLVCLDAAAACRVATQRLAEAGIEFDVVGAGGREPGAIGILVGTWDAVSSDPDAQRLAAGPAASGVFVEFEVDGGSAGMLGLDAGGRTVREFGPDTGLVAAMRRGGEPPLWVVTATGEPGVEAAAGLLSTGDLEHRYAAVASRSGTLSLPLVAGPGTGGEVGAR